MNTKFPSIQNARNLDATLRYMGMNYVVFEGTVKVHGTNARITYHNNGSVVYGSRNEDGLTGGHFGFVEWAKSNHELMSVNDVSFPYTVYGEWAGKGIQAGIPYEKVFIPFALRDKFGWMYPRKIKVSGQALKDVYPVDMFGTYQTVWTKEAGFNAEQILSIVEEVEKSCPVAAHFGFPGSVGEGVVFTPTYNHSPYVSVKDGFVHNPSYSLKAKGEKHAVAKSNQFKKEVDSNIAAFAEQLATEARYEQGIQELGLAFDKKSTGTFVKWVQEDVQKEEGDLLEDINEPQAVLKLVGNKAARWFLERADAIPTS